MPLISISMMLWVAALLGVITFSSTAFTGISSEYSFHLQGDLVGLGGTHSGLHMLAKKIVHFALFFGLRSTLSHNINIARFGRMVVTTAICVSAGIGSEEIHLLLPGRHASMADVMLSGRSGT